MNAMRLKSAGLVTAVGLVASLFTTTASATPLIIPSSISIDGQALVGATTLSFENNASVANAFNVAGTPTGSFAGATGGTIQNLNLLSTPVGTCGGGSWACSLGVDDITFNSTTPVLFDLQTVYAGVGGTAGCASSAIGATCTPPGSPFSLTQTAAGVSILYTEAGIAYTGTNSSASPISGIFTAQIQVPGTIPALLAAVGNNTLGFQSFSATFTATATPEPSVIVMMLTGLGMIAFGKRSLFVRK